MRRLVVWNMMTLDGCFEGKEPWDLGFHETVWGEELESFSLEQGAAIGTLLFGRRTYEGMAAYWQNETGAVAEMMNTVDKAVASRSLESAEWNNTRLLKGEAVEAVRQLKAEPGKDVYVFGSADLLASLLGAGLVDEYRICLAPFVLGGGTALFKPGLSVRMQLHASRQLKTGGMILTYRLGS
jgi:dihydrofolate reductase